MTGRFIYAVMTRLSSKFENKIYHLRRSPRLCTRLGASSFEVPPVLATGPELKNTFCLTRGRYAFPSQHIGDMENYETLPVLEEGIQHFERLFRIQPEPSDTICIRTTCPRVMQWIGPNMRTCRPLVFQHHHAHIAACMADNGLNGDHANHRSGIRWYRIR